MVRYYALKGLYDVEKTIGCGGFAKVKLATHIATGEKVAIKVMEKSGLGDDLPRVKLELKALKTLSHQHICKLYQVLETDTHFFIIIEYCSGGELFDHIVERNRLSENQSRTFFRQIASAVAYLHSFGYVHRDLKPENVLLNSNQSLKLIDFGLCAKPEGGIKTPLSTSCGSPTYAAPELVLGRQYLGPEVDVWSMGVLLYALLCGFLPFDDQSIDSLYKKILAGKYHEPQFLSKASKDFIKSMLQVDPKKRITIKELLSHPWITADGLLQPVAYCTENSRTQDDDCVSIMAQYHAVPEEEISQSLRKWRYDYNTATYLLLRDRKNRGLPLKLNPNVSRVCIKSGLIQLPKPKTVRAKKVLPPKIPNKEAVQEKVHTPINLQVKTTYTGSNHVKNELDNIEVLSPGGTFVEPRRPSSIRKPQKRIRSPTLDTESSPVPAKRAATPGGSAHRTPERKRTPGNSETPGSARRMLGTIERSLNRVRHVLTPRKSTNDQPVYPAILTNKDLCNVSTTQCNNPEFVISQLSKALENKGIQCERKGFSLRGKMEPNLSRRLGGCSFELEVCYLPSLGLPPKPLCNNTNPSSNGSTPTKSIMKNGTRNYATPTNSPAVVTRNGIGTCTRADFSVPTVMLPFATVGIRRKRLKGDSWCYKKVCEEVLALTATDFRQIVESAV